MALAAAETFRVGAELSADQIVRGMAALVVWEYRSLGEAADAVGQTQVVGRIASEPTDPEAGFFHIVPWLPDELHPGPTSIFSLRSSKAVFDERWTMLQVKVYTVPDFPGIIAPTPEPLKIVR